MSRSALKILIAVPYPSEVNGLLAFYKRAFLSLGHQVRLVTIHSKFAWTDWVRHKVARISSKGLSPDALGETLLSQAEEFHPDLTIIGRGERLRPEPIRRLRALSSMGCINIYPDSPLVVPGTGAVRMIASLTEYTCVFTFSRGLIPVFEQLGARNVRWLPFGFDPETHSPRRSGDPIWKASVAYLGAWGPLQESWLEALVPFGLAIYGPGWRHLRSRSPLRSSWRKGRGIGAEMSAAIGGANMVFNLVRAEHGCAHSMKTFEIPACGGFMMTNWTEEQAHFFRDGEHCVYFHTRDDLAKKMQFYLANHTEREKIRIAGESAVRQHTYEARARALLEYFETGELVI